MLILMDVYEYVKFGFCNFDVNGFLDVFCGYKVKDGFIV